METSISGARSGTGHPSKTVSKYAWGLVVASGLIWLAVGIVFFIPLDVIFGNGPASAYSAISQKELSASSRLVAVFLMMTGAFQIGIGRVPFRNGERWTWFTLAPVPLFGILGSYAVFVGGGEIVLTVVLFVIMPLSALLLSVRSVLAAKPGNGK